MRCRRTGNIMAVMDAMGHEKVDTTAHLQPSGLAQIREAMKTQ